MPRGDVPCPLASRQVDSTLANELRGASVVPLPLGDLERSATSTASIFPTAALALQRARARARSHS